MDVSDEDMFIFAFNVITLPMFEISKIPIMENCISFQCTQPHFFFTKLMMIYIHLYHFKEPTPFNEHTVVFISHASKIILKIHQARLQLYVNQSLYMHKLGLEEAKEPEIKLSTFSGS